MEYQSINGKATVATIKRGVTKEVKVIVAAGGKQPHLAIVLVGRDGGSETYVKNKVIACEQCGFKSTLIRFEADVTEEELLACVGELNKDENVDGFIVQFPLPKYIDEQKIIMAVDYRKDVDGFHPINAGRMAIGLPCFTSATPLGVLTLLQHYHIETSDKKCVILGRSNTIGKPIAQLMMQKQYGDSTITVCHSRSKDLEKECQEADIVIAAIGRPEFVTADMVRPGIVIIDVDTTRVEDRARKNSFRLCGDVKFDEVAPHCSFITPTPGSVGPMTICSLMKNIPATGEKEYYKQMTAEEHFQRGNECRQRSNWQETLANCMETIKSDPNSPAVIAKEMMENILNFYNKDAYNPQNTKTMSKMKGAIVANADRCKGCQLRIVTYPKDVIALAQKEVNVHGYPYTESARPDDCIDCAACTTVCPDGCITVCRKKVEE